uniref:Integrase core domain containing protein n=1 Tax=Solanum tuberosum TaxID=4113 RepID=M1DEU9_SOLTU
MAHHIADEEERTESVHNMTLPIKKATLNFIVKFFLTILRIRLSPTQAENMVTWDRVVMLAALVVGLEIDFTQILIAEIYERAFKTTITLPFPCLIFHLCRAAGVPIWHCDSLIEATKTVDISLIRDDANLAAPRRDPQVDLPPLDHGNKTKAVHKCLDASELRVLERPTPAINVNTFQKELSKLRSDVDTLLASTETVPEVAPVAEEDGVMMTALFGDTIPPPDPSRAAGSATILITLKILRRPVELRRGRSRSLRYPRGSPFLMWRYGRKGPAR